MPKLPMNLDSFRVRPGTRVQLTRIRTAIGGEDAGKDRARKDLRKAVERMSALHELLIAQDRWAVLLVLQGMDAAGKDGIVKHVMRGLNPNGTQVHAFKVPSAEELDHDFLWRTNKKLPERGRIGVFNRSYYEEVIVVRVHPQLLACQKLPPQLVTSHIWTERCEDINSVERYLARNGTVILKVYLHISQDEQRRRLMARLEDPTKNWKFSAADLEKSHMWGAYRKAYEAALSATSTRHAPWHVVPADQKWYARLVVANLLNQALQRLRLKFPQLTADQKREIAEVKAHLGIVTSEEAGEDD